MCRCRSSRRCLTAQRLPRRLVYRLCPGRRARSRVGAQRQCPASPTRRPRPGSFPQRSEPGPKMLLSLLPAARVGRHPPRRRSSPRRCQCGRQSPLRCCRRQGWARCPGPSCPRPKVRAGNRTAASPLSLPVPIGLARCIWGSLPVIARILCFADPSCESSVRIQQGTRQHTDAPRPARSRSSRRR